MFLADTWHLGANDPGALGWATAVAYIGVAFACARTARAAPAGLERRFWGAAAALLLLLGANKELDLQTPFIAVLRSISRAGGWYGQRHALKWLGVAVGGCAGLACLAGILWRTRHAWRAYVPACLGLALLCLYIGIRASPLRGANRLLGGRAPGVGGKRNLIELSGLALVAFGGWRRTRPAAS